MWAYVYKMVLVEFIYSTLHCTADVRYVVYRQHGSYQVIGMIDYLLIVLVTSLTVTIIQFLPFPHMYPLCSWEGLRDCL